jgi:hypothetical protein
VNRKPLVLAAALAVLAGTASAEPSPPASGPAREGYGFSITAGDRYSWGFLSGWTVPVSTFAAPFAEFRYGGAELAVAGIFDLDPASSWILSTGGYYECELSYSPIFLSYNPKIGIGLAYAPYAPGWAGGQALLSPYFVLAPLRYSFDIGNGISLQVSAMALRWGPLFPPAPPNGNFTGTFYLRTDLASIALGMEFF